VRWDESVAEMARLGVEKFIEIGPGKVLSGLVKRIAKEAQTQQIDSVATLRKLAN
jgi:[acyl-carrier-protein] S-malonyltransferase